jgi:hypothetical protein
MRYLVPLEEIGRGSMKILIVLCGVKLTNLIQTNADINP